jgi:hypothetical protein
MNRKKDDGADAAVRQHVRGILNRLKDKLPGTGPSIDHTVEVEREKDRSRRDRF